MKKNISVYFAEEGVDLLGGDLASLREKLPFRKDGRRFSLYNSFMYMGVCVFSPLRLLESSRRSDDSLCLVVSREQLS